MFKNDLFSFLNITVVTPNKILLDFDIWQILSDIVSGFRDNSAYRT